MRISPLVESWQKARIDHVANPPRQAPRGPERARLHGKGFAHGGSGGVLGVCQRAARTLAGAAGKP
jgi:hypothetical protein